MNECYRDYFYYNNDILPTESFDGKLLASGKCIYDVIRIEKGIPLFISKYLKRLRYTALIEDVILWLSDSEICDRIFMLIKLNKVTDDSLKLVFSFENQYANGNFFMAYMMKNNRPSDLQFLTGVDTISYKAVRNNPHAKVFNYDLRLKILEEISKNGAYEAILVNNQNFITEGSRSNIFFINNNMLYTSVLEEVLPGITRENVLEICQSQKINVMEIKVLYTELPNYDSVFLTGTSRKVLPIRRIDNITFNVNNSLLRKIMKLYDEMINQYIKDFKSDRLKIF